MTTCKPFFLQGKDCDWPGLLPTEANLILHQHSIQGDITPLQEALCYWLAFSQKYRERMFDATCLWNILKTLEEKWNAGRLSGEEVSDILKIQLYSCFYDGESARYTNKPLPSHQL